MTWPAGPRRIAVVTVALVSVAGCRDDRQRGPQIYEPVVPPSPAYDLSSPAGASEALTLMLAALDTAGVGRVLTADASMLLDLDDQQTYQWPVGSLTAVELHRALRNLMSGEPTTGPDGFPQSAIDSIRVNAWTQVSPFVDAGPGSPWPDTQKAVYAIDVAFFFAGSVAPPPSTGNLVIYVAADTAATSPAYRVAGLEDDTGGDAASVSFYLVGAIDNRAPVVRLTITPPQAAPPTVFHLDASASSDPEGSPLQFRWRLRDVDRPWTPWSYATAVIDTSFNEPGVVDVSLGVRDRWLVERTTYGSFTITNP